MEPNPQLVAARVQLRMQLEVDLGQFLRRLHPIDPTRTVVGIGDTPSNRRLLEALRRHRIEPIAVGIYRINDIIDAIARIWPGTAGELRDRFKPKTFDPTLAEAKRIVSQREASRRYRRKLRFDPNYRHQRETVSIHNKVWKATHKEQVRGIQRKSRQRRKAVRSLIRAWLI